MEGGGPRTGCRGAAESTSKGVKSIFYLVYLEASKGAKCYNRSDVSIVTA
jgi:hypothetical protein